MKILKIAGRNLASLAGDFSVDFESEPLASAGLFAISGPTGAGKSTLLDALCLALYGTTPRLPKSARGGSALPDAGGEAVSTFDPRNLLRRGAAEAYAEVDFVGNDDQRYRARWSVRRSRNKAAGLLQASNMTLHRLQDLTALGGTKTEVMDEIADRIGLKFEQFTRSVLLAQNEFSAFLKTDENERGELLETLTGSTIYSDISRRAFERYKGEQEAMRHLTRKLADQAPLPPDERTLVDTELLAASAALDAIDAHKLVLEQQLRWHQELARLSAGVAQAELALAAADAQLTQAAARRQRLATLDKVQEARPMAADLARLEQEANQAQQAIGAHDAALALAIDAHQCAARDAAAATERVALAESAQREAAPILDDAKRLDATVAALAPLHQQAARAHDAARSQLVDAQTGLQDKAGQIAATQRAQQDSAAWLAGHAPVEALAAQWPRWDRLFAQAEAAGAQVALSADALAAARQAHDEHAAQAAQAASGLAAAHDTLAQRATQREQATQALAAIDHEALAPQRQDIEARREALTVAERTWSLLATTRARHDEVCAQAATLEQAAASAQATLCAAEEAAPQLAVGLDQSERSLAAAELACAGNVVDLRATLVDDAPCPVCGSVAHPYEHQDARLETMLANLRDEVRRCRQQVQDNLAAQTNGRAAQENIAERLPGLQRERAQLVTSLAELDAEWQADPVGAGAPPAPQRSDWFSTQLTALRTALRALDQQEQAARRVATARDAAQQAWEQAQAAHAQLQQAAHTHATQLARLDAAQGAQAGKHETAQAALTSVLAELDPVLAALGPDWQASWSSAPSAFRAARGADVQAWIDRSSAQAALAATLANQQAAHGTLAERVVHLQASATDADQLFAERDDALRARQGERATLWDGRPVAAVEAAYAQALATARAAQQALQLSLHNAAQAEAAARTALAQARAQVGSIQAATAATQVRLADWLEDTSRTASELEAIDSLSDLTSLLAVGTAWIAQERAALAELASNVQRAATVRAERQAQSAQHAAAQPAAAPLASVETALTAVLEQRRAAHELAAGLRLRTAQDDARRADAAAVLADIAHQQAIEQRWGRLSELIGSADGKKFRNYAQQFTLDVLLGYANSHLSQLARRYRLERVQVGNAPSLALMVRDQDMGGEVRSVNSLSGGESFLVSLALALGLASLSSNRVRVESLFIDEGFGSLDSETLGVAMDALDALQSMGRKVGVISHVQEMTERISAKILVRPAGGGSSAVTVSV
ncbi:AAA family ATPase [Massilia sp. S19_KUP03_FR1]|uniref:AAA family ATPase n=1 Tax=Massilia sp. S19_KUP03_FR1 TaxID=3025503 RepID=UPI002FCD99F9